jgi:hypothetical protein
MSSTSPVAMKVSMKVARSGFSYGSCFPVATGRCLSPAKEIDEEAACTPPAEREDEQEILVEAQSPTIVRTPIPTCPTPPLAVEPTPVELTVPDSNESQTVSRVATSDSNSPTSSEHDPFGRNYPLTTRPFVTHPSSVVHVNSHIVSVIDDDDEDVEDGPSVILVAQRVSLPNTATSCESSAKDGRVFAPASRGSISSVGRVSHYSTLGRASEPSSLASSSTASAHSSNSSTSQGFPSMLSRYASTPYLSLIV